MNAALEPFDDDEGDNRVAARRRTQAREIAAQLLYQEDVRCRVSAGLTDAEAEDFIASASGEPEVRAFSRRLFRGARDATPTSDQLIREVAENWKLERIAPMDRAILRLAIFELNELPEVPPKVVINEAIDLAKRFSTAQSGAFVNGILDRLLVLRYKTADGAAEEQAPLWDLGSRD